MGFFQHPSPITYNVSWISPQPQDLILDKRLLKLVKYCHTFGRCEQIIWSLPWISGTNRCTEKVLVVLGSPRDPRQTAALIETAGQNGLSKPKINVSGLQFLKGTIIC